MPPRTLAALVAVVAVGAALPAPAAEPGRDVYGDPLPPGALARIGTVRLRHAGEIDKVALSPDGKVLVTANGAHPLRVWDGVTGALIREVPLPTIEREDRPGAGPWRESVAALAFAADSRRLHVLADSGALWACDLGTGAWRGPLTRVGRPAEVSAVGWASPDGTHFFYSPRGVKQNWIDVLAVGRDKPVARIEDPELDPYASVSVTADNRLMAATLADGRARVWDLTTGRAVGTHRPPDGFFYSVALAPDGKAMAGVHGPKQRRRDAGGVSLYGWDPATGKERYRVPDRDAWPITYTPDGRRLVGFGKRDVLVADADTGKAVHRLQGHGAWIIFGHSMGAGGKRLATGSRDHTAIIWDLDAGKPALDFDSPRGTVDVLAFSPDGKTLFTGCSEDHTGGLWSADTGKRLHRLVAALKGNPLAAAFTPDGRHVVVGYGVSRAASTGKVWPARLWGVADGKVVRELGGHIDGVHELAVSADGKQLATRDWGESVRLWDLGTGKLGRQIEWGPTHGPAAFSFPRPDVLIAAIHDHRAAATVVSDLIANKTLVQQRGGGASAPALSADGRLVAVAGVPPAGGVEIVDVGTGATVQTLTGGQQGSLAVVALSPDGRTVARTEGTGGLTGNYAVHLFDVKTGEKVRTLRGHPGLIATVVFSPDGKRLATGSWDSTALVWDVAGPGK